MRGTSKRKDSSTARARQPTQSLVHDAKSSQPSEEQQQRGLGSARLTWNSAQVAHKFHTTICCSFHEWRQPLMKRYRRARREFHTENGFTSIKSTEAIVPYRHPQTANPPYETNVGRQNVTETPADKPVRSLGSPKVCNLSFQIKRETREKMFLENQEQSFQ